jgi:hypothetical protein
MEKPEPKLNFGTWPDKDREFILSLIDVLNDARRSRLSDHISLAKQAPSGYGDSQYLEAPAAFALLAYGSDGLNALYELAIAEPPYASGVYFAPMALLAVALNRSDVAHAYVALSHTYLEDAAFERLVQDIQNTCENPALQREARRQLSRVVHSFASEPSKRVRLGNMIASPSNFFVSRGVDGSPAVTLVLELVAQGSLNISETMCCDLEELIKTDLPERAYQEYFERHPALIDPLASSIIERQHMGEMWHSDFVIRRLDDQYIFVEIEKPQDNPFTSYPHPSAALSHALGQVLNWFIWIEDNIAYAQSHGFPGIHLPRGVVVIGRNADLNSSQLRILKGLNDLLYSRIRIETYDDVLLNARNIIRNLTAR